MLQESDIGTESNIYPQGGLKKVLLREQFEKEAPFYLKEHTPVIHRKTNPDNYHSALEQARSRFERMLKEQEEEKRRSSLENQQHLEETEKFHELKQLKNQQNQELIKEIL